jgi:hypothetical protein
MNLKSDLPYEDINSIILNGEANSIVNAIIEKLGK